MYDAMNPVGGATYYAAQTASTVINERALFRCNTYNARMLFGARLRRSGTRNSAGTVCNVTTRTRLDRDGGFVGLGVVLMALIPAASE
ncbi:hypothetical protein NPX13_g8723 [Xylaria arbuscula]|uniref:Uncharacterized protein n=1 Tax=Xylaria arbuscula TaxID=114810 RepID=A0A9W8N823_9PEZI|nr:hypothetical protein NPX13_g8723 [Xylaria arbuscula]